MDQQLKKELGCQAEVLLFLSGCTKNTIHLANDPNSYYLVSYENLHKLIEMIIAECCTNQDELIDNKHRLYSKF